MKYEALGDQKIGAAGVNQANTTSYNGEPYVQVSVVPVKITNTTTGKVTEITGTNPVYSTGKTTISVPAGDTIVMDSGAKYTPTGGNVEVDVSTGSIISIPDGTTVTVTNPESAHPSQYPDGYQIVDNKLVKVTYSNITYNENGGTFTTTPAGTYPEGSAFTLPTDITKTGYTFAGWYTNGGLTGEPVTEIGASETGSKEFWAKWTAKQYNITYEADGGDTTGLPTTHTYGTDTTIGTPTKTGYTFAGWLVNGTGTAHTSLTLGATEFADNITLTATWTVNQYTITFDSDGGTAVASITQDYATTVTPPANPTKEGYTFTSWSSEIPTTMPAENLTVTAQWTPSVIGGVNITTTSLDDATYDTAYSATISFAPNVGVKLKLVDDSGSALASQTVNGLTLSENGTISGTPTAAGTVTLKVCPFNYAGNAVGDVATLTITVNKADGTASVAMTDCTYGATLNPTPTSATNGTDHVSYQYSADGSTYTDEVPTNVGSYTVKATFAETENYKSVTATANFQIIKDTGATVTMFNKTVDYGTSAEMTATAKTSTNKDLTANVTIKYYTDDSYTVEITPEAAGTYYAKAELPGTGNYNGASATATLTINQVEVGSVSVPSVTAPVYDVAAQDTVTVPDGSDYTAAITWSPAPDGGKFAPGTTYTATVTLTPDSNHKFTVAPTVAGWTSALNAGKVVLTKTYDPTAPNCTFSFDGTNANKLMGSTPGMEYSLDGGMTWESCTSGNMEVPASDISSITETTDIQVRVKANGAVPAGAAQTIDITKPAAPDVTGTNCSAEDASDGTITNVDNTMEYRKSGETGWTAITGTTVTGLGKGSYEVRYKANGTALASEAKPVTITAPAATPNASYDAATGNLTGVTSGMQYQINGGEWKNISGTEVDLSGAVTGPCTITVKNPGSVSENTTDLIEVCLQEQTNIVHIKRCKLFYCHDLPCNVCFFNIANYSFSIARTFAYQ